MSEIQEVEVVVDNVYDYGSGAVTSGDDVFNQNTEYVRKLGGLSPTFKRKLSRSIIKADSAIDSAKSKSVDPESQWTNGYSIFEVVLPPYNLEYLAKIYEISSPHYAAVNAKAAYIA